MCNEARRKFISKIYDALEELGGNISPSEIYGALETVKMDMHDKAVKAIKSGNIWWKQT